jgi:hypothetical protein
MMMARRKKTRAMMTGSFSMISAHAVTITGSYMWGCDGETRQVLDDYLVTPIFD